MEKMITFWLGFGKCNFTNLQELNAFVFKLVRDKILELNPETNKRELVKDKIYTMRTPSSPFEWVTLKSVNDFLWRENQGFRVNILLPDLPDNFFTQPDITVTEDRDYLGVSLSLDFSKTGAISMNPQKFDKDEIANVFANYAKKWFSSFKPQYAWVDLEMPQTYNQIKATKIVHQPWVSIYGPEYIAKYGKDFLLNIPAYKTEEIEGGGIFVQLSQNFTDKASYSPFEKLAEHMKQEGIELKPYQPKEMWI